MPLLVDNKNNLDSVIKKSTGQLRKYRKKTEGINTNIKQKQIDIENDIKKINDKKDDIGVQQAASNYFFIKKLHNEVMNDASD